MCDHGTIENYISGNVIFNCSIDSTIDMCYYCQICKIYKTISYNLTHNRCRHFYEMTDVDNINDYILCIEGHLNTPNKYNKYWFSVYRIIFKIVGYFEISDTIHMSVCDKLKKYTAYMQQYKLANPTYEDYLKSTVLSSDYKIIYDERTVVDGYTKTVDAKKAELKNMIEEINKMIIHHSKILLIYLEYHYPDTEKCFVKLLENYFSQQHILFSHLQ